MASPNYSYQHEPSSHHKKRRGLVDPYEIPDSPPPPPKRQRQPLPAKRAKINERKQPVTALQAVNEVIDAPSQHAKGYTYAHGNAWGAKEEKLIMKSNGIEDWEGGTLLAKSFTNLNVWNAAPPERHTLVDIGDAVVGRPFSGDVVNNSQDRTLKIRDLLHDDPSRPTQGLRNSQLRPATVSSGMLPWVAPVANMAPRADMTQMNPGNGQNSPIVPPTYGFPYAVPTWEEQRQIDMAQARTALASVARLSTTSSSRATTSTIFAAQNAPAAPAPYFKAFNPAAPALLTAPLIVPWGAAPMAPANTAFTPAVSSSLQPVTTTPNLIVATISDSQRPASHIPDGAVLETPAPVTTRLPNSASATHPLALTVPAAPIVRTVTADILPPQISPARRPNGVEQFTRRYSLQDYSVTEYSVVGSPITRAIRVLRPGTDKSVVKETSFDAPSGAFVEAPNQHHSSDDDTTRKQVIPVSYATSSVVGSLGYGKETSIPLVMDISKNIQKVGFIAQSNNLKETRQHTPTAAQVSISSPQSSKLPSHEMFPSKRPGPVTISPAQIILSEASIYMNDRIEQMMALNLPAREDMCFRELEDRKTENKHQDVTNVNTDVSRIVLREQDTEDDHMTNNASEDTASQSFDTNLGKQVPYLPHGSPKDADTSRLDGDLRKGACETSSDVGEEQILPELEKVNENHITNTYDNLSNKQAPIIEANTNVMTTVDNTQDIGESNNVSAGPTVAVVSQYMKVVDSLEGNLQTLESSSIVHSGANASQLEIQSDIASEGSDTIVKGGNIEMSVMADSDPLRIEFISDVGVSSSFLINQPLEDSSIGMDVDGSNGAAAEMEISSDLENHDQEGEPEGMVGNFRAGFRETLKKLEDKPQDWESNDEFDIAMKSAVSKDPRMVTVAQASMPLDPTSEPRGRTLSDVDENWFDTYMETDISIVDGSPPAKGVAKESEAVSISNDCKGKDNKDDEEDQVELIHGQRTDDDGNVKFLVKWKDSRKAMSWESEELVLDIATKKLLEFFKKVVFEKIGPEIIVKAKRESGRPHRNTDRPKGQKPHLKGAKSQPSVMKKRGGGRPRSSRNRGAEQNASTAVQLTKESMETSETLVDSPEERIRGGLRPSRRRKDLMKGSPESSSNTILPATEVAEGFGLSSEAVAKSKTGLLYGNANSIADDNNIVAIASENITETLVTVSELLIEKGPGRPRKIPVLTTCSRPPKLARVIRPPTNTKMASAVRSPQETDDPQHGSLNNPIQLDLSTSIPPLESSAEVTLPLSEISTRRRGGRQGANFSHEKMKNSSTMTCAEVSTFSRPIHLGKRSRGRPRGSGTKARRRAAEPTLISRIKTMARRNRGKPATRLPGEVVLPWMSRRSQTYAASSEIDGKYQPFEGRLSRSLVPEDTNLEALEPQSKQLDAEESEEEEIESAEPEPQVPERPKRESKGKIVKNIRRVQKQTRRGKIAQSTIATRMRAMGRINRGQPPSRLPGHIVMPWTSQHRKSRAEPLEIPEEEMLSEMELGQSEPEDPEPVIRDRRPRRETRNLLPKYDDAMRFDDLEGPGSATVPVILKRRRKPSHTEPLAAANRKEPQSRTDSAPTEVETRGKGTGGRRSGSGYVKDRWYYVPY